MVAARTPRDDATLGPGSGLMALDGARRVVGVAIPIPEPYAAVLQAKRAEFNDPMAHAIPPHVTLLGPTEIEGDGLMRLVRHLSAVAAEGNPFPIVLRGSGTFRPISDVVFVQVARGISGCERLEQRIRSGDFGRELAFPYHPHVTVAHDVSEVDLDRAFDDMADFAADFEVEAFWLYEQSATGQWRPVCEFRLSGEHLSRVDPSPGPS
ncbi:MAG TPA: 2'-5' RNA ligase family protein [Dermatophilaceae bacterium]|nr:2'-5' RNA ligase family protein [Dermatophilaceae bacterium]